MNDEVLASNCEGMVRSHSPREGILRQANGVMKNPSGYTRLINLSSISSRTRLQGASQFAIGSPKIANYHERDARNLELFGASQKLCVFVGKSKSLENGVESVSENNMGTSHLNKRASQDVVPGTDEENLPLRDRLSPPLGTI